MATNIGIFRESIEKYVPVDVSSQYPSIFDFIDNEQREVDDSVVKYITNAGVVEFGSTANAIDVITGEDTGIREITRTDGVYSWPISLVYYMEKYGLKLPNDFVSHITNI